MFINYRSMRSLLAGMFGVLMLSFGGGANAAPSTVNSDGTVFQTPEAALDAVKSAFDSQDPEQVIAIYGEISRRAMITGDPIADAVFMRKISERLKQRAELIPYISAEHSDEQWYKIRFSIEGWNMRVPLVSRAKGWVFATEYAKRAIEEMRRELNEVFASDTLFLLVSAQREYLKADWDGDGVLEYAQKIISTPGKRDGLYWVAEPGAPKSPLDGTVAKAIVAGYSADGKGKPYYGYRYKMLTGRANGPRGTVQPFIFDDQMTGGFAIMAFPAQWGFSGSKTFVVETTGRMYKKDLGFKTERIALDMSAFRIDSTWPRVEHPELGLRL